MPVRVNGLQEFKADINNTFYFPNVENIEYKNNLRKYLLSAIIGLKSVKNRILEMKSWRHEILMALNLMQRKLTRTRIAQNSDVFVRRQISQNAIWCLKHLGFVGYIKNHIIIGSESIPWEKNYKKISKKIWKIFFFWNSANKFDKYLFLKILNIFKNSPGHRERNWA